MKRNRIRPSRLGLPDLVSEATAGVLQRPARSILTSLGTVLGVGSFVAVLSITATASGQISGRFNTLMATEVAVEGAPEQQDSPSGRDPFPQDAEERLRRVHGVTGGGVYWPVPTANLLVRAAPVGADADGAKISILAATPGVFTAAQPHLTAGRTFDTFHRSLGARVAVLGSGVARQLGIRSLDPQPAVFIGEVPFVVIGIMDRVDRLPNLLLSVVIPDTATPSIGVAGPADQPPKMLVSTRLGAATQVARELPPALRPDAPDALKAIPPPDPRSLRESVSGDLASLFLVLAGVCLVIGTVGIANTTLVAVMERTGEIGLRRSLGARGSHIASQFLAESSVLGTLGGLFGCSLGVVTAVAVAAWQRWTPVAEPVVVGLAPVMGLATGLLAGVYPAVRAARVEPADALRR